MTDTIRDLREQKRLGQYTVSQACGIGFSAYVRIEAGAGKTTPEEVESVLKVLRDMPEGTRKLGGGRPFNDPNKRAAVQTARQKGESVAAALARAAAQPATAAAPQAGPQDVEAATSDEETPKQRDARKARERRAQKKADAAAAASGLL